MPGHATAGSVASTSGCCAPAPVRLPPRPPLAATASVAISDFYRAQRPLRPATAAPEHALVHLRLRVASTGPASTNVDLAMAGSRFPRPPPLACARAAAKENIKAQASIHACAREQHQLGTSRAAAPSPSRLPRELRRRGRLRLPRTKGRCSGCAPCSIVRLTRPSHLDGWPPWPLLRLRAPRPAATASTAASGFNA